MVDLPLDDALAGVWQTVTRRVHERAVAAVELLEMLIHGQGRVARRDQELWAGHVLLNYDRELLPRVSRACSLGISIYLGNRRIATFTTLESGPPHEVGAFAEATLVDYVLRRRQPFRGGLEVAGRPCLIAARPLFAGDKPEDYGPVGMLEAYQDEVALRDMLAASWQERSPDDPVTRQQAQQAQRAAALTGFVDDVARRLQLLALNGNIIAAQAGDHGRAFRVVCRELGALAEQAKDAAAEAQRLSELGGAPAGDGEAIPGEPPS